MLHASDPAVRSLLLQGNFGLEKEGLRVTPQGRMAHTPHPFGGNDHIVRDFCENQTEINTPVFPSAEQTVQTLYDYTVEIQRGLAALPEPELLWPFSNPPMLENEADIPIAIFNGDKASKTGYREYLSDRYGRYKMTLCGIHVNFSFGDELLAADFAASGEQDFAAYKNQLYVVLAERAAAYAWVLTALTAASPLLDATYLEKGKQGQSVFNGMASTRCSELGYWNFFAPIFSYDNIRSYADSIQQYVDKGYIAAPTELYYPVRLKPAGKNNLNTLREQGVSHIELRMFDLNPLAPAGIDLRDLKFAQLLLVWLAATPRQPFAERDQVQAVQNFKNAAHYDLKTVKIVLPDGEVYSVAEAARKLLGFLREFYRDFPAEVQEVLDYQEAKILDPERRYAWQLRRLYGDDFLKNGLEQAKRYQQALLHTEE